MSCLGEATVAGLSAGECDPAQRRASLAHLDGCDECRATVAAVARRRSERTAGRSLGGEPPRAAPVVLVPGDRVGRYEVIRRLGEGGMGTVYAAHDPQLGRRVALKLLHSGHRAAQGRLMEEARALARLRHPNVVAVHDVMDVFGRVCIAMEYLGGVTLAEWNRERRTWREIADVIAAAAQGLAAAHDAGLVHRDVKPANILVCELPSGHRRVVVTDFGLARAFDETRDDTRAQQLAGAASYETSHELAGTPGYMSPEQFAGGAVGPRTDQFALGLVAYEALWGRRPFAATSIDALAWEVCHTAAPVPPKHWRGPPRWLRRAVLRALATDPAHRFGEMNQLARAVSPKVADARRRTRSGALAIVASGVLALAASRTTTESARPCDGAAVEMANRWNTSVANDLSEHLAAAGVGQAMIGTVTSRLWSAAMAWSEERVAHCRAASSLALAPAVADDVAACFDVRLGEFDAAVAALHGLDTATRHNADEVVNGLGRRRCDPGTDGEAADATAAVRSPELHGLLAHSHAMFRAGRVSEALMLADAAHYAVLSIDDREALAYALAVRGDLFRAVGRHDEALASATEAWRLAEISRDDDTAAHAALTLVYLVGVDAGQLEAAAVWLTAADAAIVRAGDPKDVRGVFLASRAVIAEHRGDFEASFRDHLAALMLLESIGEPTMSLASALSKMVGLHLSRGEATLAVERAARAVLLGEALVGADHRHTIWFRAMLAMALANDGRGDEASIVAQQALAQAESWPGVDRQVTGTLHIQLATVALDRSELDVARRHAEAAVHDFAARPGPQRAASATAHAAVAAVCVATEEAECAAREFAAAKRVAIETLGPAHPSVVHFLIQEGIVASVLDGDAATATQAFDEALRLIETGTTPLHCDRGRAIAGLGRVALLRGQAAQAVRLIAEGMAECHGSGRVDGARAELQMWLAEALWENDLPERARAEAAGAIAAMVGTQSLARGRERAARWLAERQP